MRLCDWCDSLCVHVYVCGGAGGPETCEGCFKEIYGRGPTAEERVLADYPRKVMRQ